MSYWIHRNYRGTDWIVPGVTVLALGSPGVVTDLGHYVHVHVHGHYYSGRYHPTDIEPHPQPWPEPPKLKRRSKPDRVTEHTRRAAAIPCDRCRLPINTGERYRQQVGVMQEWHDGGFHLARLHVDCAQRQRGFEVTHGPC